MNTERRGVDDESLLRLAAAAIHEQKEEEENEYEPITLTSQEIQQRWKAVLRQYHRNKFREGLRTFVRKAAMTAAMLFAAISSTMVTAMAVSPAIREIVLTDFGKYSTLDTLLSGGQVEVPEDWQERYYPTYIPEGFSHKETKLRMKTSSLVYTNSEGMNLVFTIVLPDSNMSIDTENMTKEELQIKGHDAILYEKRDKSKSHILINYEDCIIAIFGPISPEEIIKIAESIQEKK